MRFTCLVVAVAASATLGTSAIAQEEPVVTTTDLGNGIYMLSGQGGNIGLSVGEDGAFLIDDQFDRVSADILNAISAVTSEPLTYVINTHYHGDHTGGNAAMRDAGARIVAHHNVRKRLADQIAEDGEGNPRGLPQITFSDEVTFHWNGHEIHVFHFPNAHTDGDAIIHFRNLNIIHMGDTLFSGLFPYIDLDAGGSIDGYKENLRRIIRMTDDETVIIPGHGPLSTRQALIDQVEMLEAANDAVLALVVEGMTEDEVVAANPLAPWDADWSWRFIDTERMTRTFYRDIKDQ